MPPVATYPGEYPRAPGEVDLYVNASSDGTLIHPVEVPDTARYADVMTSIYDAITELYFPKPRP